jgi:glyoxylase-like metal-dependent hydrolase (beta-lactamase superfamily II)
MIRKHSLVVGPFQCNFSLLVCEKTKEAVVIDPGDEFERIKQLCENQGAQVKYALHTHAHLDHIGATGALKRWSPQTLIALHPDDKKLYDMLPKQGELLGIHNDPAPPIDHFLKDGEIISFGTHQFSVIHTPGHSPGGVCFKFEAGALMDEPVLFSGDTLFQKSIGRTDIWDGDNQVLLKSIKDRLLPLDPETKVFPGHGMSTRIGIEARENPFLK